MSGHKAVSKTKHSREKSTGWITEKFGQDIDPSPNTSAHIEDQDADLIKRLTETVYNLSIKNNLEEADLIHETIEEDQNDQLSMVKYMDLLMSVADPTDPKPKLNIKQSVDRLHNEFKSRQ